jgi:hypothetical protein
MRSKTPILSQPLSALTLDLQKTRKLPAFFDLIFLNMLILSSELYSRHRHLLQAMGLILAQMVKFDPQNQTIHDGQAQHMASEGCFR